MVARTPTKMNPVLIRETVKKLEKCMARLQELQYTVSGGSKVISGVSLSPRSTRGYLRTSLRCKQESVRLRVSNAVQGKYPVGKFPGNKGGEWKRMSLPAMLVGETVGEILQASQFARDIVQAVSKKTTMEDPSPRTPLTQNQKAQPKLDTEMKVRRKREKVNKSKWMRAEAHSPSQSRVRSRIHFKNSPPKSQGYDQENPRCLANRVSPRNKPWAKKTVLFPNPLFMSTPPSQKQPFCKTRNTKQSPHKFLIKSKSPTKFVMKIKSPRQPVVSISPTRAGLTKRKSPKMSTVSKLRRSFSPSRLATKLVSPLKNRRTTTHKSNGFISGLKQRPMSTPTKFVMKKM